MDNSGAFQLMLDAAIKNNPDVFAHFDRTENVQDQLQEMIEGKYYEKLRWISLFADTDDWNRFSSMEQLWLAFVMKEKYNKMWNGEDWIDEITYILRRFKFCPIYQAWLWDRKKEK